MCGMAAHGTSPATAVRQSYREETVATPKEQHDVRTDAITTGTDQPTSSLPAGSAHASGTFREPVVRGETPREERSAGQGPRDAKAASTPADPSVSSSDEP